MEVIRNGSRLVVEVALDVSALDVVFGAGGGPASGANRCAGMRNGLNRAYQCELIEVPRSRRVVLAGS